MNEALAVETIRDSWPGNKHRFSGVATILGPASYLIASEIEPQELIVKPLQPILATACGIGRSVVQPGFMLIVDRGEFGEFVEQNLARRVPPVKRHGVAFDLAGFQRVPYGPSIEIQVTDMAALRVGGHASHSVMFGVRV